MTRINRAATLQPSSPFSWLLGSRRPAAVCAWSSTKIEISLVFISQSSRHLASPPFLPPPTSFFKNEG